MRSYVKGEWEPAGFGPVGYDMLITGFVYDFALGLINFQYQFRHVD